MQGEVKFAQFFNLFDHVQFMIGNRCTLPHSNIENGITSLVPLNVIRSTKGIPQHLKYFLLLSLFKFLVEFIIHGGLHNATNHGAVIEPLQISVLDHASGIGSRLLRCRIRYHIKDPLMLQDYL